MKHNIHSVLTSSIGRNTLFQEKDKCHTIFFYCKMSLFPTYSRGRSLVRMWNNSV